MEGVQNAGRYAGSKRRRACCGRRHEPCGGADAVRLLPPRFAGKAAGAAVKGSQLFCRISLQTML